ncbi:MAG: hypothetical protein AAGL49_08290, partial [Pseudomonadota bacterium]
PVSALIGCAAAGVLLAAHRRVKARAQQRHPADPYLGGWSIAGEGDATDEEAAQPAKDARAA